jgi:threonine dehydrogenase-like Zn-dependent dehydrogenase
MNKQLWFVQPGLVELRNGDDPPPPPAGHIQVAVACGGLCRFDVALFEGVLPHLLPRPAGHEAVGTVAAVGEGVGEFEVGQSVSLIGEATARPYFSQRINVPSALAAVLPDRIEKPALWLAEPAVCVVSSLALSPVRPGARVAVVGTGFMGILFVQGLRGQPASEVVGIDLNERRLNLAATYGAVPCHLDDPAVWDALPDQLGSFEMVIETAGTQDSLDMACSLVAPGGELVLFAWHKAESGRRHIDASTWHQRGIRISNNAPVANPNFAALHQSTIDLMARGLYDLRPLMTHVSPFEDAQELFDLAADGADGYVKGAMTW